MKWIKWIWYYCTKKRTILYVAADWFNVTSTIENCHGGSYFILKKKKTRDYTIYTAAIL